ncbi:MAG: PD-(D/E)XK nuclease family protein [Actinomycetota bacterium]
MAIAHTLTSAAGASSTLQRAVAELKGGDVLAPVTLLVANSPSGVMARRGLGRHGVAAIDAPTIGRFANDLAAGHPDLAHRRPVSGPVLEQVIDDTLRTSAGPLAAVARHPTSIRAMRDSYRELRLAGPEAQRRLTDTSTRGATVAAVTAATHDRLRSRWYDEADALTAAIDTVRSGRRTPSPLVVYLPDRLDQLAIELVAAVGAVTDVRLILTSPGDALVSQLGSHEAPAATPAAEPAAARQPSIISTTDADDECRWAARTVIALVRSGVALDRIMVVWPTMVPYARSIVHHLDAAGIGWNGRGGTALHERTTPRVLLDLLELGRRGLRRRDVFAMLAGAPIHTANGLAPVAEWERVSRLAGVVGPDDWHDRLAPYTSDPRWGAAATSLAQFVERLATSLDDRPRGWADWVHWARSELTELLGDGYRTHLSERDVRADEALDLTLDHIAELDQLDVDPHTGASSPHGDVDAGALDDPNGPRRGHRVTRARFLLALTGELDDAPTTEGRVGHGVTVCSLHGSLGVDADAAVVVGASDATLPPRPTPDPVLSDGDRLAAGLATSDDLTRRLRQRFDDITDRCAVTFTSPRGDLRQSAERSPSPWIRPWFGEQVQHVASAPAGLLSLDFPATPAEHRWRRRLADQRAGVTVEQLSRADVDPITRRAADTIVARAAAHFTPFDGDLTGVDVPSLATSGRAVSPSRLEAWARCPHAYFVRYLLGVEAIDEFGPNLHVQPLDRGTAVHAALDRFHRAVLTGELPQPGSAGWGVEHRTALLDAFDAVCTDLERAGRVGRPSSWADRRDEMRDDLLGWLAADGAVAAERGSVIVGSEVGFDGVAIDLGDNQLAVRGSIDRVDRAADGRIIVTDHKTGSDRDLRGLDADDPTLGGRRFQLATYAAAADLTDDAHVRAEYGFFGRYQYRRIGIDFDPDATARATAAIAHTVDGIDAGWFPNRPQRPGWRLFVDCPYCEPDGLGTGELHRAWRHKRVDPRAAAWFGPPEPEPTEGEFDDH